MAKMFDAIAIARLANIENGSTDMTLNEKQNTQFRIFTKRLCGLLSLLGSNTRSLFIFSEENFIRRYAKMIIEWGYPFFCFFLHFSKIRLFP
jgi:hypothetical protein